MITQGNLPRPTFIRENWVSRVVGGSPDALALLIKEALEPLMK
jgi:hypothetical protein